MDKKSLFHFFEKRLHNFIHSYFIKNMDYDLFFLIQETLFPFLNSKNTIDNSCMIKFLKNLIYIHRF